MIDPKESKKLSKGSSVGETGCFHWRVARTTRRKQAALRAKTKLAPANGTNKPPNAGPIIPEMLSCKPLKVAAEGSSPSDTTWGTIDVKAGALKAKPTPRKNTPTRMRQGLRRCSQPSTAIPTAMAAKQRLIVHTNF